MSILNNDLYKFTMQQAVLERYPDTHATYHFINRRLSDYFNEEFVKALRKKVENMSFLFLNTGERNWLEKLPFIKTAYLEYLSNYRYHPDEVQIDLEKEELKIIISGPWHKTILWEVPLMALVSELYFKICDKKWSDDGQNNLAKEKGNKLQDAGVIWADFGTRRRRDYASQRTIVKTMRHHSGFIGTSNVHLAHKYNVSPIGTLAHEWTMAHSVLASLRRANHYALEAWTKVYNGNLGIALTDTYGTDSFFADFRDYHNRFWNGVRHDSGDPIIFAEKVIKHYESHGIDPVTKTIVFSDGLDVDKAIRIHEHCKNRIKCSFGIGTHFSNDYPGSQALNMVIKLRSINGIEVVKLSDVPTKATGDKDALRVARYMHFGIPLDEA